MPENGKNTKIDDLSQRQKEILRLVARHLGRKEIATHLSISQHTVKKHIDEARRRLGVNTEKQAVRVMAESEGLDGTPIGVYPIEAIVKMAGVSAEFGYDPDISTEHRIYANPLDGAGPRPADADDAEQIGSHRGRPACDTNIASHRGPREGYLQHGELDSLADVRGGLLADWLSRLSNMHSIYIILLLAVILAFGLVALVATGATMMQAVENLTGQTR